MIRLLLAPLVFAMAILGGVLLLILTGAAYLSGSQVRPHPNLPFGRQR